MHGTKTIWISQGVQSKEGKPGSRQNMNQTNLQIVYVMFLMPRFENVSWRRQLHFEVYTCPTDRLFSVQWRKRVTKIICTIWLKFVFPVITQTKEFAFECHEKRFHISKNGIPVTDSILCGKCTCNYEASDDAKKHEEWWSCETCSKWFRSILVVLKRWS